MPSPSVVWHDDELTAVTFESLLVCKYPKGIGLSVLERSYRFGIELARAYPQKYCTMTITKLYPLPDEATRKRAAEQLVEISPLAKRGAVMFDGDGFAASTARAILSGIQLLSGRRSHLVYTATVEESVKVLTEAMNESLGKKVSSEDVRRAIDWAISPPTNPAPPRGL